MDNYFSYKTILRADARFASELFLSHNLNNDMLPKQSSADDNVKRANDDNQAKHSGKDDKSITVLPRLPRHLINCFRVVQLENGNLLVIHYTKFILQEKALHMKLPSKPTEHL
jgi:hypothetical protein